MRSKASKRSFSGPVALTERLENRRLMSGTFYLKADSTSGYVDEWSDSSHPGSLPYTSRVAISSSLTVTGETGGEYVWVDESAGPLVNSGGTITVNGNSGYTSSNQIQLIGTTGNDTFKGTSSSLGFGNTTISYSNVGFAYLNPNGGTDSINISSGTTVLAAGGGPGITVRQLSYLNVASGAELYVQTAASHSYRTCIVAPNSGFLANGEIDMTTNDIIVTSGNWGGINGNVANGDNLTTSAKNGLDGSTPGITTLGVVPNNGGSGTTAIYSTFDGVSVSYSAVIIKFTYLGDSNDDGTVTNTDYTLITNGYTDHLTGWYNGDYNYDGVINGSDFSLIDAAYNDGNNNPIAYPAL